jgi:hypothetical protein
VRAGGNIWPITLSSVGVPPSKSANREFLVGFEILTAVVITSSFFWDIMPYSPLKVNGRVGGTCHIHLQVRSQHEEYRKQSLLGPGDGGYIFLRNVG